MSPKDQTHQNLYLSTVPSYVSDSSANEFASELAEVMSMEFEVDHHEIHGPAAELAHVITWIGMVSDVVSILGVSYALVKKLTSKGMLSKFKELIRKGIPTNEAPAPAVRLGLFFASNAKDKSVRFYFHRNFDECTLREAVEQIPLIMGSLPIDSFSSPGGPTLFGYFYDIDSGQWTGTTYFESGNVDHHSYERTWFPPEGLENIHFRRFESAVPENIEIQEYRYDMAFRDDLSTEFVIFVPRSTQSELIKETLINSESYKRNNLIGLPQGSVAHPYEIPPAANTWEYFALLSIDDGRRLLGDLVLLWEASKLIKESIRWMGQKKTAISNPGKYFLSQAAILSLVIAHQVEEYGFQKNLRVTVEPRGKFTGYNSPDHPNSTIYYLVRCATEIRVDSYLVDGTGQVLVFTHETDGATTLAELPDILSLREKYPVPPEEFVLMELSFEEPVETLSPDEI